MTSVKTKSGKTLKVWVAARSPHVVMALNAPFTTSGVPMTLMEAITARAALDAAINALAAKLKAKHGPAPTEPPEKAP